jgi:hypothetical protein
MRTKRLIIHQPTNHYTNKFRYQNIFFDNLISELSKKHDVISDRYFKNAHLGRVSVNLGWTDDFTIEMHDCEMIIEDYDTKETKILSVADDLTPALLNLQNYENVSQIFISQFIRKKIIHHINPKNEFKYQPWVYFPSNEYDLEFFYQIRKKIVNKINKLYFRGETESRQILKYFDHSCFHGGASIGGFESYVKELINYEIGLSIAGRGEMCYRDVEYMALGIPLLRFEYTTEFNPELIPNFHYISVERPDDLKDWMNLDRNGLKQHADMIKSRFEEIKNDKDFLNYISDNARKYYENYLSPESVVSHTINLLNL